MSEQNNSHGGHGSSGLLAGIVIGAALTYLFATKSGRKLKDELLKEGLKALQNLGEELEEKEAAKGEPRLERREEVEAKLDSVKKEIVEKSEEVKDQAEQIIQATAQDVPEHIRKIQKKGRRFFFRKPRIES